MSIHDSDEREIRTLRQQVNQLEAQLRQVEQDRDEYLQNVSHQIVAPLNAMKWHIENLTQARVSYERGRKVLRSIYSQATLAVHLAKNFRLMSNLAKEHSLASLREPLQAINLCRLLINLSDDFQPLAWDDNVQLGVNTVTLEHAPEILAIKPLISQVFSNIIENAVKYSAKESRIEISGEYSELDDTVSVFVRNRGVHIPDSYIDKIFDRGVRSPEARAKYPAGTGFGLYIARRIVELHEGRIFASTEGDGKNCFTVTLAVKGLIGKAPIRKDEDNPTR